MRRVEPAVARCDRLVLAIAAHRHGIITTAQLVRAGITKDAVASRLRRGWLRRIHRGVYLVGPLDSPLTRPMAAVAACGEGALLSHGSAAALWDLRPAPAGPVHVTVSGRWAHRRDGIRVHNGALHPADITTRHKIPVTSPARTLLDLATHVPQRDLDRATEEAQVRGWVSMHSLHEQFRRYPRHRGTAALRAATRTEPTLTRSEAERRLLELIRQAQLPAPRTNRQVCGFEVDFHWPDQRLVVEVDGFAFHSSRRSFEQDRRRDAILAAGGWRVVRVTWRQIVDHPMAVVATLATAIAA